MSKKRVKQDYNPTSSKVPKVATNPDSFYSKTPLWSFTRCDFEHERWGLCTDLPCLSDLLRTLKDLERQKWADILTSTAGRKHTRSHSIPIGDMAKEAQKRLLDINLDEFDCLYSLTITGKRRIWGIIEDRTFCIVWFDREHEICPSNKVHT